MESTTKTSRVIAVSEQHLCGAANCGQPATIGVTDAVQQPDGSWTQSATRFGCRRHPVEPMVHFVDGNSITWKEYRDAHAGNA